MPRLYQTCFCAALCGSRRRRRRPKSWRVTRCCRRRERPRRCEQTTRSAIYFWSLAVLNSGTKALDMEAAFVIIERYTPQLREPIFAAGSRQPPPLYEFMPRLPPRTSLHVSRAFYCRPRMGRQMCSHAQPRWIPTAQCGSPRQVARGQVDHPRDYSPSPGLAPVEPLLGEPKRVQPQRQLPEALLHRPVCGFASHPLQMECVTPAHGML